MIFQVPQFIEVEDKIFGPLTFKQFVYLIGGAGACFIVYVYVRHISTILAMILMVPVGGAFVSLAFQKVNGRPMIITVEAAFNYFRGRKLYLWKRKNINVKPGAAAIATKQVSELPKLSESKLRDLSWSLDINEKIEK